MKIYLKLLKIIYLDNYYTDFIVLVAKVCVSYSSTILSLINFNFPLVFKISLLLVGWLCLTSHRQRGHLETAPPFAVPCEGREAR